jgi:hypothetical protein
MPHSARCLGRMGLAHSHLVAPMLLIFVSLDSSWPKTIYKKGPPMGRERAPPKHRNMKQEPGRSKIEGGNSGGALRVCSPSPLMTLPSSPWWRGSSPPLDYGFVVVAVDGFRVARTRGTTRRTQGFERRGLNMGDLGLQWNRVTEASRHQMHNALQRETPSFTQV